MYLYRKNNFSLNINQKMLNKLMWLIKGNKWLMIIKFITIN